MYHHSQHPPSASATTLLLRLDHWGEMNFPTIYYVIPAEIQLADRGMELPFRATDLSCGAVSSRLSSV